MLDRATARILCSLFAVIICWTGRSARGAEPLIWRQRYDHTNPELRWDAAMVFDSKRGKLVLFGGHRSVDLYADTNVMADDTWELDGSTWVEMTPVHRPPRRSRPAMVFDPVRGRTVLQGGTKAPGEFLTDTWEWDGTDWQQLSPAMKPGWPAAIAYSAQQSAVVAFDGTSSWWTWDGDNWTSHALSNGPDRPSVAIVVHDSARNALLMFASPSPYIAYDLWSFDGSQWKNKNSDFLMSICATSPSSSCCAPCVKTTCDKTNDPVCSKPEANYPFPVFPQAVSPFATGAFDSDRNVFVVSANASGEMWEWDGTHWTQKGSLAAVPQVGSALAYDAAAQRTVRFGGSNPDYAAWEWNGAQWSKRTMADGPPPVSGQAAVYDETRQKTLVFGGNDDSNSFWSWDGSSWSRLAPGTMPAARTNHAMAYDANRGRVVLFGGSFWNTEAGTSVFLNDTWEWNGSQWLEVTPATSPSGRTGHALTYDRLRHRTVLFGGTTSSVRLNDTWEWDGTSWIKVSPVHAPTARRGAAMTYDAARGKVLLFGGDSGSARLNDTWEWDGADWIERNASSSVPARHQHGLAYDDLRQRVILYGGDAGEFSAIALTDTWEWDGSRWTETTPAQSPERHTRPVALTFDSARGCAVYIGGYSAYDVWEYCAPRDDAGAPDAPMGDVRFTDAPGTDDGPAISDVTDVTRVDGRVTDTSTPDVSGGMDASRFDAGLDVTSQDAGVVDASMDGVLLDGGADANAGGLGGGGDDGCEGCRIGERRGMRSAAAPGLGLALLLTLAGRRRSRRSMSMRRGDARQ